MDQAGETDGLGFYMLEQPVIAVSGFAVACALLYLVGKHNERVLGGLLRLLALGFLLGGVLRVLGSWFGLPSISWLEALVWLATAFVIWQRVPRARQEFGALPSEGGLAGLQPEVAQREALESGRARLRQVSDEHFLVLFEQETLGVFEISVATGNFLRANFKFCDLVGSSWSEVQATDYGHFLHPDDRARVQRKMQALQHWEFPQFSEEVRLLRRSGDACWVMLTASPVWQSGLAPESVIVTVQDVAERKRIEIEMRERLDELQRWHRVTLGREERILQLKQEVNELLVAAGQSPRYDSIACGGGRDDAAS